MRNVDNSDLIGTKYFVPEVRELFSRLRRITAAPLILGGAGAAIEPVRTFEEVSPDAILYGDAEKRFPDLLRRWANGISFDDISGLVVRRGGRILHNALHSSEPIDGLPDPDLFPPSRHEDLHAARGSLPRPDEEGMRVHVHVLHVRDARGRSLPVPARSGGGRRNRARERPGRRILRVRGRGLFASSGAGARNPERDPRPRPARPADRRGLQSGRRHRGSRRADEEGGIRRDDVHGGIGLGLGPEAHAEGLRPRRRGEDRPVAAAPRNSGRVGFSRRISRRESRHGRRDVRLHRPLDSLVRISSTSPTACGSIRGRAWSESCAPKG